MNDDNYKLYKKTVKKIIDDKVNDDHFDEYIDKLGSEDVIGLMPTSFYRYRPFNEYTLSEIINQHIFLSPIDKLDDKLDSKYIYKPFGEHTAEEETIYNWRRPSSQQRINEVNKEFAQHIRIACLTQDHKNMPMWNYYAQGHKGICIKYRTKDFNNDYIFLPVIYPSKRKKEGTFKFFPADNQMKCGAVFNSIVKDESWKFEKEWRVIQYVDDDKNHYVDWNMSDIYLGCDISDESVEIIKNIIIRNGLKIALHKMNLSPIGLVSTDISI